MNGNQVETDIVSVFSATEDKDKVCHYNITICTSLLCDDDETGASKSNEKNQENLDRKDDLRKKLGQLHEMLQNLS